MYNKGLKIINKKRKGKKWQNSSESYNKLFFYIVLNMLLQEKKIAFCCCSCFSNEWSRYSDSQEVNFFLFGSSHLPTEENVELFFYAQQFIKESKRFCFLS